MSFREKFNWMVLGATSVVLALYGGWYALRLNSGEPVTDAWPVLAAYVAWIVIMLIATIVIAATNPAEAEEPIDERDKFIDMKASQPAMHTYGFALTALAAGLFFFDMDKWAALHAIVFIQLIATIVEAGAKVHFYRMPI